MSWGIAGRIGTSLPAGTGPGGRDDVAATNGTVTLPVDYAGAAVRLTTAEDDRMDEGPEQFNIRMTNATSDGSDTVTPNLIPRAILTINDPAPVAPPVVTPGASMDDSAARVARHEMILPEVTRAVVGQQMSALIERVGAAGGVGNLAGFNLNGQSRSSGGVAFWGSADYHDFSGEDGDSDWDGDIASFHLGVDGQVRDGLLAGVMVSYSDSESEYSQVAGGNTQKGDYELDLTSVSPYLNWNFANAGAAWVSVSYGSGEVEVTPDNGTKASNDINMQSVAFGGSRRLQKIGARELRLKADVFVAQAEVEGDAGGLLDDLEVDANRARVALRFAAGGGKLTRAFDFGARHDGGDGRAGTGMEIGGEVGYRRDRLTLQGRARALLAHSGDQRGWGVGGLFRVASGADGQGLSLSVAPSYGGADADSRDLWDNGLAMATTDSADELTARLDAEVGYGLPSKLTPYSAMRLGDERRDYRLGMRWSAAQRLDLDLSARRANADDAVTLQGRWRF